MGLTRICFRVCTMTTLASFGGDQTCLFMESLATSPPSPLLGKDTAGTLLFWATLKELVTTPSDVYLALLLHFAHSVRVDVLSLTLFILLLERCLFYCGICIGSISSQSVVGYMRRPFLVSKPSTIGISKVKE